MYKVTAVLLLSLALVRAEAGLLGGEVEDPDLEAMRQLADLAQTYCQPHLLNTISYRWLSRAVHEFVLYISLYILIGALILKNLGTMLNKECT